MSLWWKKDIHGLFCERLVTRRRISDLDNVQLATLNISNCEAEQGGVGGVALHAELGEGCGVAFDGLTDLSFDRVQLKKILFDDKIASCIFLFLYINFETVIC